MTEAAYSVLVVDDEPQLRRLLRGTLVAEGFRVIEADTARRALIEAASHKPDLVLLDLGLPDADGQSVVAGIRQWSAMPIVVLSARTDERQKIVALDAGADDYVTKPFTVGELLARVRAALRRASRPAEAGAVLR
ncbi:MAG: response regulator, partial [Rhodocyclaceae bacterium]